jgi:hypothetical protein
MMLGPVLGQLIYVQLQFERTFYCFAGILSVFFLLAIVVLPSTLNHCACAGNIDQLRRGPALTSNPGRKDLRKPLINSSLLLSSMQQNRITYRQMLGDRRVLVAVISSAVAMVLMFFFDSILSDHLLDIDVSDSDIGTSSIRANLL